MLDVQNGNRQMENKIQLTDAEKAFFFHLLANSGNKVPSKGAR